jgi:hypothetical protein
MWQALLEKLLVAQLVKKFPNFYRSRSDRTWASSVQATPALYISRRSILILSSYIRLCLVCDLFPLWVSDQIFYCISRFFHACNMTHTSHSPYITVQTFKTLRQVVLISFHIKFARQPFIPVVASTTFLPCSIKIRHLVQQVLMENARKCLILGTENGSSKFFRNVSIWVQVHTALQPRRPTSIFYLVHFRFLPRLPKTTGSEERFSDYL